MEYTCIYEAAPNKLITLPFVVLSVIELFLLIYSVVNWKKNNIGGKIGLCIVLSLLLLVICSLIYNYCSSYAIWSAYEDGDYFVAEGIIEDYVDGTEEKISFPDRFKINDTPFIISNSPSSGYGYTIRQSDGGILENSMHCKIFYVPFKNENIIMKILVEQQNIKQLEQLYFILLRNCLETFNCGVSL